MKKSSNYVSLPTFLVCFLGGVAESLELVGVGGGGGDGAGVGAGGGGDEEAVLPDAEVAGLETLKRDR